MKFKSRKRVGQNRPKIPASNQILAIEKEIRETPYNKSTERHIGLLRAKISKLKDQAISAFSKGGGGGGGYAIKKQGDATVVLVGPPSAGKSTLINKLTNAESKVAPYAFTTVSVIPGMMKYNGANIQILDVPGLIEGAEEGRGRGREVLSVVRGSGLLVIITDEKRIPGIRNILEALERNGIRVNKNPKKVRIKKELSGGLAIHSNIKQDLDRETIITVAGEMGIKNGDIYLEDKVTLEELIDSFSKNRVYIPAIFALNKIDMIKDISKISLDYNFVFISAEEGTGLDELKEIIWDKLGFIVVYLVKTNEEPNNQNPVIVKAGTQLKQLVEKMGSDFAQSKSKAKIWGNGAKFPGQEVSLGIEVKEGMQVRFI